MYHKMSLDEVLLIAANPNHYNEYNIKCAIHNLNNAINHNKIVIKQYKQIIELLRKGVKTNASK